MDQGSLNDLLKKQGPFKEEITSYYTNQICQGIFYLHSNSIIHRDIKCQIKLADLGNSKKFEYESLYSLKGSFCWIAPEILNGENYERYADIWSLGCTIYEMLTGQPPFIENYGF